MREIYLSGGENADMAIDITAQMDRKIASLRAHVSQLGDWDFEPMIRSGRRRPPSSTPAAASIVESFKYFKID